MSYRNNIASINHRILITGSEGLIGQSLRAALEESGALIVGLDVRGADGEKGDVRNREQVAEAVSGCDGVVHLGAVSRVIWGEDNPNKCWDVNVGGLSNVVEAVERRANPPWLLFGSSREVYGQPEHLPATEDTSLQPVNVYGRSKVEGESIIQKAQDRGLRAGIVRFSNVYGSLNDYTDRVVPAFILAALSGNDLRVDGTEHTFDFTHIDDTTRGIISLIHLLANGERTPPVHLTTGRSNKLIDVAAMIIQLAGGRSSIREGSIRSFDVDRFYGNPARAHKLLGWTSRISLQEGLEQLIKEYRSKIGTSPAVGRNSAMKILQVIHGYPMLYNAGSEVYTQTLCHGLSERHEVHVFTREEDPFAPDFRLRYAQDLDEPRVSLHIVNNPRNKDRYQEAGIDQRFAETLDRVRPEVVHVGHLNHLSISLLKEAAIRSIPIVYTLHDYWVMCPRGQFMQRFPLDPNNLWASCDGQDDRKCAERCYSRYFGGAPEEREADVAYWTGWVGRRMRHTREMTELVSLFIAPARYLYDRYRDEFGLPEHKLVYLDYGFDLSRLRGRERVQDEPFTFGYIGTHRPAKGINDLIQAFSNVTGKPVLRIWGRPQGQETKSLKAFAQSLPEGAADRVEWFPEYRNQEIVRDVFNRVDTIVVPSLWVENSPLVIHEAQQARIPVITADVGGMAEYVHHEENGLQFKHRSVQSLAGQMQRFVDDPALARRLGERGYVFSKPGDVPDIKDHVSEMEQLYRRVLNQRDTAKVNVR